MITQKVEEWSSESTGAVGNIFGHYELFAHLRKLIGSGKKIVSIIPTRYYGTNQSDIEKAIIITEDI